MKSFLTALFLTVFLWGQPIKAQTFAPRSAERAASSSTETATKRKTPDSPVSAAGVSQNNENPSAQSKTAPNVIKNMNGENERKKEEKVYDNSDRKVFTFKIVDGEILIDKDAPRSILISYGNYSVNQGFDGMVRCSLRIYVMNDFMERITNFSFKLHWPDLTTSVQMNRLNPGVNTYKDILLLGKGCFNLDKVPTIEVNRCRVKGMTQEQCADAVRWGGKK